MGFSLRDKFNEATAQLNVFDGGKSAVTVRRDRQNQVAQTLRKKQQDEEALKQVQRQANQRNVQALRSGQISREQYQQQSNKIFNNEQPKLHDFRSTGFVRNIFDANTGMDKLRRVEQGQPANYRDQQIAMGNKRPYENLGAQVLGNSARLLNTTAAAINSVPLNVRMRSAMLTNNMPALENAIRDSENLNQVIAQPDSGLFGAGTIYDSPEDTNISTKEALKRGALTSVGTMAEVAPFKINPLKNAKFTTRLVANAGVDALAGAGESVARQYANTGKVDARVLAGDVASNALLGAVPTVTTSLVSPKTAQAIQTAGNKVTDVAKNTGYKIQAGLDPIAQALNDDYFFLNQRWQTATPQGRRQIEQAIKKNREEFKNITREKGGYIQIGGGKDTPQVGKTTQEFYHGSTNPNIDQLKTGAELGLNEKRNLIYLADTEKGALPYTKNRAIDGTLTDSTTGKVYKVTVDGKIIDATNTAELGNLKGLKGYDALSPLTKRHIDNANSLGYLSPDILEVNPELVKYLSDNGINGVKTALPNSPGDKQIIVTNPALAKVAQVGKTDLDESRIFAMRDQPMNPDDLKEAMKSPTEKKFEVTAQKNQEKIVKDYAKELRSFDESVKGGQMQKVSDGMYDSYKRVSDHSPFYREVFAEKGRKPILADYVEEARRQIENGKAPQDLVKAYKDASNPEVASLLADESRATGNRIVLKQTKADVKERVGTEKAIPVTQFSREGDVVTAKQVNPELKKGEKRYSVDDSGELIEDRKGAYRLFTDDDGRVKGLRIGNEYVDAKELGDLSNVNDYGSRLATMRRNIERSFGKGTSEKVNKFLVDHQQAQATKMITRMQELNTGLKQVADDLGINFKTRTGKAKKISADIQNFGEGKINAGELASKHGDVMAGKIIRADKWFRGQYDSLLDEMNRTLTQYGYDPVPKRKNYYTHFQDESLWKKFGLKMNEIRNFANPTMQDALPNQTRGKVPNKLAGETEFLQPNKRFNPFALQRKGDVATPDAFQAFERYMSPTLNNIYMTPSISRARVLAKAVAQDADIMGKDASRIIQQTKEWANRLAGKSNRMDRPFIDGDWSNKVIRGMQWAQKKAGQNSIVGNLSTAVMQPIMLTQTAGKFGYKNTILGLMQEMSRVGDDGAIKQSSFLKRRYANLDRVTAGKMDAARNVANKPLEVVEQTATRSTWRAAYNDALSQGMDSKKAVQYADVQTEKTVAGRSIGEKPELFESKAAGLLTMYQLEVNNFWQQFGKEMTKAQAAKAMVAAFGLNVVLQEVSGRQVGFNPIDAAIDSYEEAGKEDKTVGEKAKAIGQRFAGEVIDNVPFVAPVANFAVGDKSLRSIVGGDSNVGRFGVSSPVSALNPIGNPSNALNLVLPFGGAQLRKTWNGVDTLMKGALDDKEGKTLVNVPQTPENIAKGVLFGNSAIPEVNQYYNNIGKKKVDQKPVQNQTDSKAKNMGVETPKTAGSVVDVNDTYALIEDAFRKTDGSLKGLKDYSEQDVKKAIETANNNYKEELKNAGLPVPNVKFDSLTAQKYASYKNSIKDKNELEVKKKTESFYKDTYKSQLNDIEKSFYNLGDDDMRTELEKGTITREQMDKIIELDDLLTNAGLQPYTQVGKKLRAELGYGSGSTKSSGKSGRKTSGRKSGSRSSKGKASNFDLTKMFAFGSNPTSTTKSLRQLLKEATLS